MPMNNKYQSKNYCENLKSTCRHLQLILMCFKNYSLAAQREQYLKDKVDQQDQYKRALSAQVSAGSYCNSIFTKSLTLKPLHGDCFVLGGFFLAELHQFSFLKNLLFPK